MAYEDNPLEMSLIDHLDDLRNCLIRMILGIIFCSILCLAFSERLLTLFLDKAGPGIEFVALSPTEGFMTQLKLGILSGIIVSSPYLILQLWRFVAPGLRHNEVRFLYRTTPFLVILFLSGVGLAYQFVIPLGLEFLLDFQIANVKATLSIERYVSFCFTLLMVFGILFELPVVLVILAFLGLFDHHFLRKFRAHVIVSFFVLSAVLTPPDIITQTLVAIPMILLYEISIIVIAVFIAPQAGTDSEEAVE